MHISCHLLSQQLRRLPTITNLSRCLLTNPTSIPSKCSYSFWATPTEQQMEETYSHLLSNCVQNSDVQTGKAIHASLIKHALLNSLYLHNHLLNMYVKCGDLVNGLHLFDRMIHRNVVSWTALIAGFVQMGFPFDALSLFSRMHTSGIKPNEFTFVSALQACSFVDCLTTLYQVYAMIVRFGYGSNVFLVNAFLTGLIRHCKLDEALEVFQDCEGKDIVSWNAMMDGYTELACFKVPGFWHWMNNEGVRPDKFTFASLLTGLAEISDVEMGIQVHARVVKSGHGSEMCVGNSLVDMYLKNKNLADGFKVFQEITCKDVCSWTQMAAGCLDCGEPGKALGLISEMRISGVKPNKITLATAFNACSNLASLEEGCKVHTLRIKLGDDVDVCVDNALLNMYAKCGCMDCALAIFRSMIDRTIVSWTTMIMGYAQNGHAREALEFFDQMKLEGVEPNYITSICVLYACSQGGFIDEGWNYFYSMINDHGISPQEDHYVCMVNLLGRAGYVKEAEELILQMPFQPGARVWQSLLAASQLHGDVETAKRAAQHALDLDEEDPSTYVLLSNTLAGLSKWDDVGKLRDLMKSIDINKMPGSSWIMINSNRALARVHEGVG